MSCTSIKYQGKYTSQFSHRCSHLSPSSTAPLHPRQPSCFLLTVLPITSGFRCTLVWCWLEKPSQSTYVESASRIMVCTDPPQRHTDLLLYEFWNYYLLSKIFFKIIFNPSGTSAACWNQNSSRICNLKVAGKHTFSCFPHFVKKSYTVLVSKTAPQKMFIMNYAYPYLTCWHLRELQKLKKVNHLWKADSLMQTWQACATLSIPHKCQGASHLARLLQTLALFTLQSTNF